MREEWFATVLYGYQRCVIEFGCISLALVEQMLDPQPFRPLVTFWECHKGFKVACHFFHVETE